MSLISDNKKERIKIDILRFLYDEYPKMFYTYEVADALTRNDEFILGLLVELKDKKTVHWIEETGGGKIKRKWGMSELIHNTYKELL